MCNTLEKKKISLILGSSVLLTSSLLMSLPQPAEALWSPGPSNGGGSGSSGGSLGDDSELGDAIVITNPSGSGSGGSPHSGGGSSPGGGSHNSGGGSSSGSGSSSGGFQSRSGTRSSITDDITEATNGITPDGIAQGEFNDNDSARRDYYSEQVSDNKATFNIKKQQKAFFYFDYAF